MSVFSETQKFDQWFMIVIYVAIVGILIYCSYTWYIAPEAVDKAGLYDTSSRLLVMASMILTLFIFYLFRLTTEIDEIGVHYRFRPIHFSRQTIRWDEMEKCYVRTYSPIREYGGWGYRFSVQMGKAYNVKGNKGIQIVLKSGKKILIGTQRMEDADAVIQRYLKKTS